MEPVVGIDQHTDFAAVQVARNVHQIAQPPGLHLVLERAQIDVKRQSPYIPTSTIAAASKGTVTALSPATFIRLSPTM